ncbi:sensor histidine kinase [Natrononativus amylolyticus]|uniref:sensor histidine kinase n=1 Tax=Natrononativus amylolyticus TaxID=2963434 RepID=UPI0020CEBD3A|nr:ATP-binding protein [Natrononativus amylolyticus]
MDIEHSQVVLAVEPEIHDRLVSQFESFRAGVNDQYDIEITSCTTINGIEPEDLDCLVIGTDSEHSLLERIEAAADRISTVPIVAITSENEIGTTAALSAGASDIVVADGSPDDWGRLAVTRVLNVLEASHAKRVNRYHFWKPTLRSLVADEDVFICVFDTTHQHVFAAGTQFETALDPATLEGRSIDEAFTENPVTAAHLNANYTAALKGERRVREFVIGEGTYIVETRPLAATWGLTLFQPAPDRSLNRERSLEKIERLHTTASRLESATSHEAITDITVESAETILEFEACVVCRVENDLLLPVAASASDIYTEPRRLRADEGIAGRTFQEEMTFVIDDIDREPAAKPTDEAFRSALSVPIDGYGIFQVLSEEPTAFTETDRELAELLTTHVAHALKRVKFKDTITQERDRFAALFQNIPDAAVRYEFKDGIPHIKAVNSAFVRLFGYEPKHAIGASAMELLVPEEERDAADKFYETVTEGGRLDREVVRQTVNGRNPFLVRSVPVSSDDDRRQGYFIYTDISEMRSRERELQGKNERLDAFASIVSHDLRNPLNVAQGYLEMAVDTGDSNNLKEVDAALDRITRMIDELLALAREGALIGETERVELEAIVRDAWKNVDTGAASLTIKNSDHLTADPHRLQELFENLIRNAIEHNDGTVTIQVGTLESGGFFVADNGEGIPEHEREQVLDMGFSTNPDGTGFGLSIVTEIAGAHGWEVSVTQSDSGGARFEIMAESKLDDGQ